MRRLKLGVDSSRRSRSARIRIRAAFQGKEARAYIGITYAPFSFYRLGNFAVQAKRNRRGTWKTPTEDEQM